MIELYHGKMLTQSLIKSAMKGVTLRAALYARISTFDKKQSTDLQLNELNEYVAARKWTSFEFVDEGESGAKQKRPALEKLLLAARRREIDVVVVWRLDRLGRSLPHLLQLLQEFQALGVAFVSLREAIDMTTPTGKLLTYLLAAFSEFEKDLICERVKAGLEAARRKGKTLGRRPTSGSDKARVIAAFSKTPAVSIRTLATQVGMPRSTVHQIVAEYRQETACSDGEVCA